MKVQEKHLWAWLKKADKDDIHISRIENVLSKATPDVEASIGTGGFWLELKTTAEPKRSTTLVKVVFQPGQAMWLVKRWKFDCGAWLLLQVGKTRFLIPGGYARDVEEGLTVSQLTELATLSGHPSPIAFLYAAGKELKVRPKCLE